MIMSLLTKFSWRWFIGPVGKGVLIGAVVGGVLGLAYNKGKTAGKEQIQAKWDRSESARDKKIMDIRLEAAGKVAVAEQAKERISNALVKSNERHDAELARVRADAAAGLRRSEQRAQVYQRLAEGTAAERGSLGSHAAELDRTLERGREVVGKLVLRLEQRESEIRLLGEQILEDRKLMEPNDGSTHQP